MGQIKPFRLDDDTIIYVQTNGDIDSADLAQSLEPTPETDEPEDDLQLPGTDEPGAAPEGRRRTSKGFIPNRHGVTDTGAPVTRTTMPSPAQRVGTLVKTYTSHVIQDLRNAALTEVQVEKVTLEFGIGLDTTLQIPYIASNSMACSVKVGIECKLTSPQVSDTGEVQGQ
ncbi:MAG: CU044_2847 family protein [Cyanobacteria bacterium J06632_22]